MNNFTTVQKLSTMPETTKCFKDQGHNQF